jgi:hypothetical protein
VLLILTRKNVSHCEVYVAGHIDAPLTVWLAERLQQAGLGAQ